MSNSPLVVHTNLSPNNSGQRKSEIDTITIHCFVAQVSVERGCEVFANPNRGASCNYVVSYDGKVGLVVEEKNRSWCTSSSSNDNRAITIEVASDNFHPYAVTEAAYETLINLVADICKRNNIKELKWENNKSLIGQIDKQNMTIHRWFANKACPGDYLLERHTDIANKVNELLKVEPTPEVKFKEGDKVVPIELVNWEGTSLVQYDDVYYLESYVSEGEKAGTWALMAKRDNELVAWARLKEDNIKKVD